MTESEKAKEYISRATKIARRYCHSKSSEQECVNDVVELLKWWEDTESSPDVPMPVTPADEKAYLDNGYVKCTKCSLWLQSDHLKNLPCSLHATYNIPPLSSYQNRGFPPK